jgi:2-oxo-4-hydroxy-4-carboxy-5-ureidoimidazoline decarboxylase
MIDVAAVNAWSAVEARAAFLRCCGSCRWAEQMTASRPFPSEPELLAAASRIWHGLDRRDWLEAFAAHPEIGNLEALRAKFGQTGSWSAGEQAGVAGAREAVLQALAEGNRRYRARFGHIFIVCATGKTAAEMLALLQERLDHDPEHELAIAAGEQEKITQLRLEKLFP